MAARQAVPRLSQLIEILGQHLARVGPGEEEALQVVAFGEPLGFGLLEDQFGIRALEALEQGGRIRVERHGRRMQVTLAHPLSGRWYGNASLSPGPGTAVVLTAHPPAPGLDTRRAEWACSLADNRVAQDRLREAEAVLLAACVLAEALLGPDDTHTTAIRRRLHDIWDGT